VWISLLRFDDWHIRGIALRVGDLQARQSIRVLDGTATKLSFCSPALRQWA
jgi:hypothetical protein